MPDIYFPGKRLKWGGNVQSGFFQKYLLASVK